jgi:hypothetical protein
MWRIAGSGGCEHLWLRFTRGTPGVEDEPISGRVSRHGTSELTTVLVPANFGGVRKSAEDRWVPFGGGGGGGGDLCRGWNMYSDCKPIRNAEGVATYLSLFYFLPPPSLTDLS